MKTKMLLFSLWVVTIACPVAAQTTKLKVAYPTDVNYLKVLEQSGLIKSYRRVTIRNSS